MDGEDVSSHSYGLRHRSSAGTPSTADQVVVDNLTPSARSAWDQQLSAARRAVSDRIHKQMDADGWDLVEEQRAGDDSVTHDRIARNSRASSATGSSDGEEEVKRMFATQASGGRSSPVMEEVEAPDTVEEPQTVDAPPEQHQTDAQAAGAQEDRMCRICFDGEDEELGRLFSPCQCRGTSRYVHVKCLDRWRAASKGATAFYKCDQCGYEYRLRRTKIAGLTQNRFALSAVTFLTFTLLIFLAGFVANWIISFVEARAARLSDFPLDDLFVSDYVIMGEGVREAVQFFGSNLDKTGFKPLQAAPVEQAESGFETRKYRFFRPMPKKLDVAPPLLRRTVEHFIKGFSLVGITSFAQLFLATTFMGPFGIRGSLFRAVRPGRRRNGDNQTSMTQIVIVMFVLVGAVKAVTQVYKGVRWCAKRALGRVEGLVMDV